MNGDTCVPGRQRARARPGTWETHLVDEDADHVGLCTLERPERAPEVELQVVLLALHADAQQDPPLAVQVHPLVVREEVPVAPRVQADVRPPYRVVLAHQGTVAHAHHQPQRLLHRNIERLVPWG